MWTVTNWATKATLAPHHPSTPQPIFNTLQNMLHLETLVDSSRPPLLMAALPASDW